MNDPEEDTVTAAAPMTGCLDDATRERIAGWAMATTGTGSVDVDVWAGERRLGRFAADRYRADLAAARLGSGCHGFEVRPDPPLDPQTESLVSAIRADDGAHLPGSPMRITKETAWAGCIDLCDRSRIEGWACEERGRTILQVTVNGALAGSVAANRRRDDLINAGIGDGRHGFIYEFEGGLPPAKRHVVRVTRESDGRDVPGSPVVLEAAEDLDDGLLDAVAAAAARVGSDDHERRDRAVRRLATILSSLLDQRADDMSGRTARTRAAQFRRRWGINEDAARQDNTEPRALIIDADWPQLDRDAGSCAVLSHAKSLGRLGYKVSIAASEAMETAWTNADGLEVCGEPWESSVEELLRRRQGCFDVVYLHRADVAARYMTLARRRQPSAQIIYAVADLHHVRLARQAAAQERIELAAAARRMRLIECTAAWQADAVITHSPEEAKMLQRAVPEARVHVVPWDLTPEPVETPLISRSGVAFVGNYAHEPNADAAAWLAKEILPLVRRRQPDARCLLVGSNVTAKERALGSDDVIVVGHVPNLRRSVLERVRATVAPLRWGAGVKGKVLDSMAAGVPCAMTSIAAEGIELTPMLKRLVADDAAGLAQITAELLDPNSSLNHDAAAAGLAVIAERYGTATVDRQLAIATRTILPSSA